MTYNEFITLFRNKRRVGTFRLSHYDRGEFLRNAEADGCVNLGNSILTIRDGMGMYLKMIPVVVWYGDPATEWDFELC